MVGNPEVMGKVLVYGVTTEVKYYEMRRPVSCGMRYAPNV